MTAFAVQCTNLTRRYGDVLAIDSIDLAVRPGEMLSIVGPSGSGKTTAIRLIAGFEPVDAGEIALQGTVVSGNKVHIAPERRRVGMVFQEHALFPHKNVAENVSFGLHKLPKDEQVRRLRKVLDLVRLTGLERRYPHELSGGQQQRVALARALAPEPTVLLLDEPFSNLDADMRSRIRAEVRDILKESAATVVFVTHDQEEALFMGDTIAIMNEGKIEQTGTPEEVFHEPATKFAANFLGIADFLSGNYAEGNVKTELGVLAATDSLSETVDVMTRPDDLDLTGSADGVGTVVSRTFQGMSNLYDVRLPSGTLVRAQRPHHERYEPGDRVSVSFGTHYVPRYFVRNDGKATE
jgi:iron(III) transport system ATP-binding protein